jgi:hypothetical protein
MLDGLIRRSIENARNKLSGAGRWKRISIPVEGDQQLLPDRRKAITFRPDTRLDGPRRPLLQINVEREMTNRFRRGVGILVVTARSESRLPAATIAHPSGKMYSPSLRSSTSW